MVKSVGDYEIPYDGKGNLLHYASAWAKDTTWMDNNPFQGEMELMHSVSGRSAKYVIWKDRFSTRQFPMFVVDLVDLIKYGSVTEGRTGFQWWTVRKRGQNYGLALLERK